MRQGDLITAYQGETVIDVGAFRNRVALTPPGSRAQFTVLRDGQRQNLAATIGMLDEQKLASTGPAQGAGSLGLTVQTLTPQLAVLFRTKPGEGAVVTNVEPGSIAALAGSGSGTVIVQVNCKPTSDAVSVKRAIDQSPGNRVLLLIRKNGIQQFLVLNW